MELWICPLKENMNKFMTFQAGVYYPSLIFVRLLYCLCSVQPMYMCRLLWFFFFFLNTQSGNCQFSLLYIKPNSCWSTLPLFFSKVIICIHRWGILLTQNSPSECPGVVRVVFQRNLWGMLQMLILKSQHFLPPITLVFLPETIASIKNTMPLKTKCIIIKFIPNLSTCTPHLILPTRHSATTLVLSWPPQWLYLPLRSP